MGKNSLDILWALEKDLHVEINKALSEFIEEYGDEDGRCDAEGLDRLPIDGNVRGLLGAGQTIRELRSLCTELEVKHG